MTTADLLQSDFILSVTAAAAGAAWAFFRGSEWYGKVRDARARRALQVLEAAVEETFRSYVSAIKASRADGKLTAEEQRNARRLAQERAMAFARAKGLDLARELGAEALDLWTAKLVKQLKGRSA